jgi:hypothetical protein
MVLSLVWLCRTVRVSFVVSLLGLMGLHVTVCCYYSAIVAPGVWISFRVCNVVELTKFIQCD